MEVGCVANGSSIYSKPPEMWNSLLTTVSTAPPLKGDLYTCADWNESSTLESEPYPLSKVLAEKAAWEIAKREGVKLLTMHPVFVIGPVLSTRTDATSIKLLTVRIQKGRKQMAVLTCGCMASCECGHVELQDVLEGRATTFSTSNLWCYACVL